MNCSSSVGFSTIGLVEVLPVDMSLPTFEPLRLVDWKFSSNKIIRLSKGLKKQKIFLVEGSHLSTNYQCYMLKLPHT